MADVLAHFHGGPLMGQTRTLDAKETIYPYLDDERGLYGRYVRNDKENSGQCFEWRAS